MKKEWIATWSPDITSPWWALDWNIRTPWEDGAYEEGDISHTTQKRPGDASFAHPFSPVCVPEGGWSRSRWMSRWWHMNFDSIFRCRFLKWTFFPRWESHSLKVSSWPSSAADSLFNSVLGVESWSLRTFDSEDFTVGKAGHILS